MAGQPAKIQPAKIHAIHRYPVKGLTPEPLPRTVLAVHQTVPFDRMYAIENGPSGFDPAAPAYLPKQRFLMLMRNARLAELRTAFDETSHTLTIRSENREAARGDLRTPEGRAAIERFFAEFCADELRGPPKVLRAEGHSFSNVAPKVISIINLASVAALEEVTGAPVHPLRFRGNLQVAVGRPGTSSICNRGSIGHRRRWSSASYVAPRPRWTRNRHPRSRSRAR
jgi:uncharacterized protein YcbX